MPQNAEKIKDHVTLFREPEYKDMLRNKRDAFECPHSEETVREISEWSKSEDLNCPGFSGE